MTLISSISGTRGTIGGEPGKNLTPQDAVLFSAAFAQFVKKSSGNLKPVIVIGRDARPSGGWLSGVVCGTLQASGADVIDIGLSTTPTVEMAVIGLKADAGIILTASHNPMEWNALKLLNNKGEFISAEEGAELIEVINGGQFSYASVQDCGGYISNSRWLNHHINEILKHPLVDISAIKAANLHVAIDPVNSSGGIAIPALLEKLGVNNITLINGEPTGLFAHNPEPLKAHLSEICDAVKQQQCDLGIVVDPDVDRLAFISEDGEMFGEEYTLVAIADYMLKHNPGPVVSNLSSSRALSDVAAKYNQPYHASAVGEVNVVLKMKEVGAVLGGEGNGGIILPELHYGRDALVGIALFLSYFALLGMKMSELRKTYPQYEMAKNKVILKDGVNPDIVISEMKMRYSGERINTEDGLKIDFDNGWVHLRKSNTEPIIRIYTESKSLESANSLATRFEKEITTLLQ